MLEQTEQRLPEGILPEGTSPETDSRPGRIDRWDNVKAVMIFLVVMGHFMYYLAERGNQTGWIRGVYFAVYLFHMPVFVFISGMMERHTIETGKNVAKKVTGYLLMGFVLRLVIFAIRFVFRDQDEFHLILDQSVVWYVIALAAWIPLTRAFRRTDRRFFTLIMLVLSLAVGYDPLVGGDFCLSRILTFYPFFLMGTMSDPRKLDQKLAEFPDVWKTLSLLLLIILFGGSAVLNGKVWLFLDLIKGWKPYNVLKFHPGYGAVFRAFWYIAAAVSSFAVVLLIPREKGRLTEIGKRTLPIYLFHRPLLHLLWFLGGREFVKKSSIGEMVFLLLGVLMFWILAHPAFQKPVDWFWRMAWREDSDE